jgi:hypothetical protein
MEYSSPVSSMTRRARLGAALACCARPEHLRRTARVALVVGVVLTLINQSSG